MLVPLFVFVLLRFLALLVLQMWYWLVMQAMESLATNFFITTSAQPHVTEAAMYISALIKAPETPVA